MHVINQTLTWAKQSLACLALAGGLAVGVQAETVSPAEVIPPNGTFGHEVVDLALQTSVGELDWTRAWTGTYWRFNRQWDGISASYKPLATQATGGGVALASSGDSDGCWVWVEDGDGGGNAITLDAASVQAPAFAPANYLPFNVGYSQQAVPLSYASVANCAYLNAPSEVFEGYRRLSSLYVGGNGTYIFKNRYTLKKQNVVRLVATHTTGAGVPQSGDVALTGVQTVSGWRWQDKKGDWIEYDDNGEISRYGDRNNNAIWLQRNADGLLERLIDAPAGATGGRTLLTLQYSTTGYLAEVKDYPQSGGAPDLPQRRVQYSYGPRGELAQVTDVLGQVSKYEYDAKFRLNKLTDPLAHATTLTYDGDSTTVASLVLPDGATTTYSFSYDDTQKQFYGRVQGPVTDAGQRTQSYVFDRAGDMVEYDLNGQPQISVTHDTAARTETVTNARGFATVSTKNEFELTTHTVNPDGTQTSTQYDPVFLNPVSVTDEAGSVTQYTYDAHGNVTRLVRAASTADQTSVTYELDNSGRITRVNQVGRLEANGISTPDAAWQFVWTASGQLAQTTDPENNVRSYGFDRAGNLISSTDPLGNITRYGVDAQGKLLTRTDALGRTWTMTYDAAGNLLSSTDPRGKQVVSSWDALGRSLSRTNAVGGVAHSEYNAEGLPVRETDEDGRVLERQFDAFLRVTREADALGNVTTTGYQVADGSGAGQLGSLSSPTSIAYPTSQVQTRFDKLERLTSQTILNPVDSTLQTINSARSYDPRGGLLTETDAYGNVTHYTRNALGMVTGSTDRLGKTTSVVYDVRGNILQKTDANGHTTSFSYDRNNRPIQQVQPSGLITRYEWDANGRLIARHDPAGNNTAYGYDLANRQVSALRYNAAGTLVRTTHITWDAADNLAGWADHDELRNETTSTTATFDDANRKTGETFIYPDPAGGTYSLSYGYGYSLAGFKTSLKWPDNTALTYAWGDQGALQGITIPGEGAVNVDTFQWLSPTSMTLPGGSSVARSYDGLQKLSEMLVKNPSQQPTLALRNTFGLLSELKQSGRTDSTGTASSSVNTSFTYDAELRLSQAAYDKGGLFGSDTETFQLDSVGNRLSHSRVTGAWVYDSDNRLLQRGVGAAATTYDYDPSGNLTRQTLSASGVVLNYDYDTQDRLVAVRRGTVLVARYGYDPMSRRTWKEQYRDSTGQALNPALRTYYLYGDEGLLAEATQEIGLANDGSVLATVHPVIATQYGVTPDSEFSSDVLFVKTRNAAGASVVGYYHRDQLGTPLQMTDKTGAIIWSASYDAFGQATITTPNASATGVTSNVRSGGQYFDAETGLHYNYHRYYDPALGRYITEDPIGLAGGVNRYAYLNGNPLAGTDPTGLIEHQSGEWKDCGKGCRIRIDWTLVNGEKKRHLHWECKGKEGAFGEFGESTHGGQTADDAPGHIKECARKKGFGVEKVPDPEPAPEPGSYCLISDRPSNVTAGQVVGTITAGYIIYRVVRMIPSLFPPLWETIPLNAATP